MTNKIEKEIQGVANYTQEEIMLREIEDDGIFSRMIEKNPNLIHDPKFYQKYFGEYRR